MNIENFYTDHESHCPIWPNKNSCDTDKEYLNKIFLVLKKMLSEDLYTKLIAEMKNTQSLDDFLNFMNTDQNGINISNNIDRELSKFVNCETFLTKLTEFLEPGIFEDYLNNLAEDISNLDDGIYTNSQTMNTNRSNIKDRQETEFIREYRLETSDNNITKLRLKYIIFILLILIFLIIEFLLIFL